MTSISKNVYIDKLDDIVYKYNNKYHITIKMKAVDVKPSTHIDSVKEDPKFKVGDIVRTSKYKNVFAKGFVPNQSKEVLVITKVKHTLLWLYLISDLKGEKIFGTFYKKELQKTNQKEFRVEKVIKAINYMLN